MEIKEEFKGRPYVVSYDRKHCGEWLSATELVWAYSAADARCQVELSIEGRTPKDSPFRVTKIKPAACLGS